jgi:hypothetical protein
MCPQLCYVTAAVCAVEQLQLRMGSPYRSKAAPPGGAALVLTKHAGGKAASSAAQGMARSCLNRCRVCHMAIMLSCAVGMPDGSGPRGPREHIWQITDDSWRLGIPAKSDRPRVRRVSGGRMSTATGDTSRFYCLASIYRGPENASLASSSASHTAKAVR